MFQTRSYSGVIMLTGKWEQSNLQSLLNTQVQSKAGWRATSSQKECSRQKRRGYFTTGNEQLALYQKEFA